MRRGAEFAKKLSIFALAAKRQEGMNRNLKLA